MDIITRKQINMLIQLAEADKHFSSMERQLIFDLAKKRNFPTDTVKELIKNPEPIESLGALSDAQKFEYLYSCIDLMLVDERIFESELMFCKNVAIKLGFRKNVVEYMQQEINNLEREDLKYEVLSNYT